MAAEKRPQLKKFGSVLDYIKKVYGIDEKIELHEAVKDWQSIAGADLAKHSKPLFFQNRILYIGIEGSAWAQEISFRKRMIIDGVNNRIGRPHVKDIRTQLLDDKNNRPPDRKTKR